MPFAQVKEDKNGQKVLIPITESTSTTAADALALAENALPLDGSKEMTGAINLKSAVIDRDVNPAAPQYLNQFYGHDKNGKALTTWYTAIGADGRALNVLNAYTTGEGGADVRAILSLCATRNGITYATAPHPDPAIAPADAIMTKKAVADNYLAKAGGEVSGELNKVNKAIDVDAVPSETIYNRLVFKGDNNVVIGTAGVFQRADGTMVNSLDVLSKNNSGNDIGANILVVLPKDGTAYATAPHPRSDNYGTDIVNMKAMKDYAPVKNISNIYVGGANASDTANLNAGRGLTPEMPFASFAAAKHWLMANCINPNLVYIYLQSDLEWNETYPWLLGNSLNCLNIASYPSGAKHTLHISTYVSIFSGHARFDNLNISHTDAAMEVFRVQGGYRGALPVLTLDNCHFSGATSSLFNVFNCGTVIVNSNVTGDITGKKYSCTSGSTIIGASYIPGTIDGTHDASSVVA